MTTEADRNLAASPRRPSNIAGIYLTNRSLTMLSRFLDLQQAIKEM